MNIALVDDSPEELLRLEEMLREYAGIHQLDLELTSFSSAERMLSSWKPLKYTVIFLDIYMDGISGTEAAGIIRQTDEDTILIFLTTSQDHRADAFRAHAYDYLEKPFTTDTIFSVMDHVCRLHTEQNTGRFLFTLSGKDRSICFSDILYLQSEGNYINIRSCDGEVLKVRMTFSAASEQVLPDNRFLTIVRGIIVNLDHVKRFVGDTCVMTDDTWLLVRTRKGREMEQIWHNYNFAKLRREALRKGGHA